MKPKTAVLLALLTASPAWAQFQGPRLNLMLPLTEPDTQLLSVSTAPPAQAGSVYVISKEKMEQSGYASATDELSLLPGIFVRRTNAFGRAEANIRGWGSDGQRIALMVDGRPENMAMYGCAVTQTLPLNNVERVEVVEGPASALYGSGALGGAVNIVTRGAQSPFEGDVEASYGSYNTRLLRVRAGGASGPHDFFAAAERRTSDGYTDNSAYEGNDYTIEYGRKLGDEASVRLRNKFYAGTEHDPAPQDNPAAGATWFDYRRGALDLSGDYRPGEIKYTGRLFTTYGHHSFSDGWLSDDETYGGMLNADWKNEDGRFAKLGAEHYLMMAKRGGSSSGAWDKREYSLYGAGGTPVQNLAFLDGALRWAGDSGNYGRWLPSAGLAVKPWNEVEVYGKASKAVRFPQISELYVFGVSNPGLEPETAWGYEAGAKYAPLEKITLRAAAFMTQGDNLIQVSGGKFSNVGDFLFRGVTGEGQAALNDEISLNASYTFLDPGVRTSGRPAYTGTGGLSLNRDDWGLSADCLYVGKYYAGDNWTSKINDFFTLNARAWWNLDKSLQLYLGANNILDRRYVIYATNTSTTGQFLMPGFMMNAGMKYSFGG